MKAQRPRYRGRVPRTRALARAVAPGAAVLLVGLAHAPALRAQAAASAVVTGQALVVREGKPRPVPFTLVTLGNAAASGVALTGRDGRFRFGVVPPGDYRLRLEKAGFRADTGVSVHLASGDSVELTLHDGLQPLVLPPADTAGGICYPGVMLGRNPTLSALWGEARKAARARSALDLSYSYNVRLTERLVRYYIRRESRTLRSTPAVARALAASGGFAGYGVGMDTTRLVAVSEMLEVLGDDFLRTNCLKALPDRGGERRLRFQPLVPDRTRTELVGIVVLDHKLTLKNIMFEYRKGGKAIARGVVTYGDGGLPGGQLRFVSSLRVDNVNLPETADGEIALDAAEAEQQATVYVDYGKFAPDTPAVRP